LKTAGDGRLSACADCAWRRKKFPAKVFPEKFHSGNLRLCGLIASRSFQRRHDFHPANDEVEHAWKKMQEGISRAPARRAISRNKLLDKMPSLRKMGQQSSVAVQCVLNHFAEHRRTHRRFIGSKFALRLGRSGVEKSGERRASGGATQRPDFDSLCKVGHDIPRPSQERRGAASECLGVRLRDRMQAT
jgi:hypothetical protein